MKKLVLTIVVLFLFALASPAEHNQDIKFIADTLVVQADGKFAADPDLATLTFAVFAHGQKSEANL